MTYRTDKSVAAASQSSCAKSFKQIMNCLPRMLWDRGTIDLILGGVRGESLVKKLVNIN